jgi:AcrR family transcriptional regulator
MVGGMADPVRLSRAEQQRRTRRALLEAAAAVFAEDGYHAASLEGIAARAGFSKGAVYSNFEGKAELFLAVMDLTLDLVERQRTDLFGAGLPARHEVVDLDEDAWEPGEWDSVGFGLATLEFIAAASRSADLRAAMGVRVRRLVDHFVDVADASRSAEEPLPSEQLGTLLVALDQGLGVLSLIGVEMPPAELWGVGLRRLADPVRAGYDVPAPLRREG